MKKDRSNYYLDKLKIFSDRDAPSTVGKYIKVVKCLLNYRKRLILNDDNQSINEDQKTEYSRDTKKFLDEGVPIFKYLEFLIESGDIAENEIFYLPLECEGKNYDASIFDNESIKIEVVCPREGKSEKTASKRGGLFFINNREEILKKLVERIKTDIYIKIGIDKLSEIQMNSFEYYNQINDICDQIISLDNNSSPKDKQSNFCDKISLSEKVKRDILDPKKNDLIGSLLIPHIEECLSDMSPFILRVDNDLLETTIKDKLKKPYLPNTDLIVYMHVEPNFLTQYNFYLKSKSNHHYNKPELFSECFRNELNDQRTFKNILFINADEDESCFNYIDILENTVPIKKV